LAATLTDVEHAFLQGSLTVLKMWHSLLDESTQVATVLGSWSDIPDLLPHNDIVVVFRDKSKQTGKAKATTAAEDIIDIDMDAT
jgi:hypothetical protein